MIENKFYTKAFYEGNQLRSFSSAKKVLPIVNNLLHPSSVIDIGCGVGYWLKVWKDDLQVPIVRGYEGPYVEKQTLQVSKAEICFHDLKLPIQNEIIYDLAMSLEVAEHLPDNKADLFVTTLTGLSDVVLFSAAIPGQEGAHHINEQTPDYWAEKFESKGYFPFDLIRPLIWNDKDVDSWYQQNILLYVKINTPFYNTISATYPVAKKEDLLRIHPVTYFHKVQVVSKTSTVPKLIYYQVSKLKKRLFKYLKI